MQNQNDSQKKLVSFIERIEKLETEKSEISEFIREVYTEAKTSGFEPKIMKKIVTMRKKKREDLEREEELTDLYARIVGIHADN